MCQIPLGPIGIYVEISHGFAYEGYRKFLARPEKHKKHMESFSEVSIIVYNFNNKNLVTFEDNFGAKGDLSMAICFYYETTVPTDNYFDPQQKQCSSYLMY